MSENAMLFIHALTSLHPGSGAALGVVDLPVQRERHTGWPIIPGSSLKGVLRDECRQRLAQEKGLPLGEANEHGDVVLPFGPARIEETETSHAGAVSVTDARVVAFPVRSMAGVFAWVTCPAVLQRLARDLALVGGGENSSLAQGWPQRFPAPQVNEAAVPDNSSLLLRTGQKEVLILEEFEFNKAAESADDVAAWFADHAVDEVTAERMRSSLVVLCDDDFTYFVRNATEIVPRIGLDYKRKTVKQGALFYEEFLPPETLLVCLLNVEDGRKPEGPLVTAGELFANLRKKLPGYLQIGADETIGKGLCAIHLAD